MQNVESRQKRRKKPMRNAKHVENTEKTMRKGRLRDFLYSAACQVAHFFGQKTPCENKSQIKFRVRNVPKLSLSLLLLCGGTGVQRFTHATLAVFAEVCVSSCTMTAVQVGEASDSESLRASVNALNTSRLRSLLPLKYYTGSMRGGFRNEGYLIGVFIKNRESYYLGVYVRGPLFSQTPMWLKQHPYAKVEWVALATTATPVCASEDLASHTPAPALTYWTPHEQRLSRAPVQCKVKHCNDFASACGRVLRDPEAPGSPHSTRTLNYTKFRTSSPELTFVARASQLRGT